MNYGLIGEKLGHSYSVIIHNRIGDYDYRLFEIAPGELDAFMRAKDFSGINVTIPYKQAVIPYLDEIDPLALEIGAVNTVVNRDGKLCGYNTDIYGMEALAGKYGIDIKDKKVLILGTGGTSRTAYTLARKMGASEVLKVSRHASEGVVTYEEAAKDHSDAEVLINTTPCGMFPNTETFAIDPGLFKGLTGILDVVYNPLETVIVKKGRALGINCANGLYMLVMQAVKAAELFFDTKIPETKCDEIYESLKEKLS